MGLEDEVNDLRRQQKSKPKEADYGSQPAPNTVTPDRVDPGLAALIRETIPLIPRKRWIPVWKVNGRYYELQANTKQVRLRLDGEKLGLASLGRIRVKTPNSLDKTRNYGLEQNDLFLDIYSDGGVRGCGRQHYDHATSWNASSLETVELDLLRKVVVETLYGWKHVK